MTNATPTQTVTVAVPDEAQWDTRNGEPVLYANGHDLDPALRVHVPSEQAARALYEAARATARYWGVDW